jgi:hypothetical protein
MNALILHDKYTEEIIGTVLLKEGVQNSQICDAWDEYQLTHNSNLDSQPDIYDFVAKGNWELCEVLEVDFYQPH